MALNAATMVTVAGQPGEDRTLHQLPVFAGSTPCLGELAVWWWGVGLDCVIDGAASRV
jgi:hypothetical protein